MKPTKKHIGKACLFADLDDMGWRKLEDIKEGRYISHNSTVWSNAELYVPCPEPKLVKDKAGNTWAVCLGIIAKQWYELRETDRDDGLVGFGYSEEFFVIGAAKDEGLGVLWAYTPISDIEDNRRYMFVWKEAEENPTDIKIRELEEKLNELKKTRKENK